MKIISKITKQKEGWWLGELLDGSTVPLATWMTDSAIKVAVAQKRDARNIFKILTRNRYYAVGHPLGDYDAYEGTTIIFW